MNVPDVRFAAAGAIRLFALLLSALAADAKIDADCTFNGKRLWGKVQIVTSFPSSCGNWQYVNSFPDLKVQFFNSFPDVKIKFVTSFPGLP